jgi:WXG100 family type VII secretion target
VAPKESGELRAEIGVILWTAGWVDGIAADLNDEIHALRRDVDRLMDRWTGSAADTHSDAWTDWFNNAGNIVAALRDDATALRAVTDGYLRTDGRSATNIAALLDGGTSEVGT